MQNNNTSILSTRPLDELLLRQAAAAGIHIDTASFIQTIPLQDTALKEQVYELLRQPLTVVFTSMNAADAVADLADGHTTPFWNIFGLGTATRAVIYRRFGLNAEGAAALNASALADQIIAYGGIHEITFFCGDQRRDELPEKLKAGNIRVNEIVVYKTYCTPQQTLKDYDGILFFSPSAVESYCSANIFTGNTVLFAIGDTTAACLRQHSNNTIVVSDLPGKVNLVEKAIAFFNQIKHTNEHIEK